MKRAGARPLLEVRQLSVLRKEGGVPLLHKLSFTLWPGECLGLTGSSGSGKSLTAFALMRLLPWPWLEMAEGELIFQGRNLRSLSEAEMQTLRGAKIALVHQDAGSALHPTKTIGRQFAELCAYHPQTWTAAEQRQRELDILQTVGFADPTTILGSYPHQLSGGMRQRVLLALALFLEPDLVIADEPSSALDASLQAQIMKILRDYVQGSERGLLLISHDIAWLTESCQRILVCAEGRLVEEAESQRLLEEPQHAQTKALLIASPFHASHRSCLALPVEAASRMTQGSKPSAKNSRGSVLLEARQISFAQHKARFWRQGQHTLFAIKQLDFTIHETEACAFIGESGSGKSTLARLLTGVLKPQQGQVFWRGRPLLEMRGRERARCVQLVMQDASLALHPHRRLREQLLEVAQVTRGWPKPKALSKVEELAHALGLNQQLLLAYPQELSGGQRQRMNLVRALLCEPQLLICDESLSSLDRLHQHQLLSFLEDWRLKTGMSLILIAHDLPLLAAWTDRSSVLCEGQWVEEGPSLELWDRPRDPYTQRLLQALPKLYRPQ